MTIYFKNVFINETSTITGPYEKNGPLSQYFDKSYNDLYFNQETWEQAEEKIINESIDMLKEKSKIKDIDILLGGDLLNQIVASNYAASKIKSPFIGIYSACSTSTLGLILASTLVDNNIVKNAVTFTSSHNNGAEKQYRYPVEYGGPKPKTTTFTSTGAACALLSKLKKGIKLESGTIGRVVDSKTTNIFHMGAVMAKAAASTINRHLKDTNRTIDYYDLVLTGDLGIYGKEILKDYLKLKYDIILKNYNDTGTMLYDLKKQPVYAGASGPVCAPLVTYGYIFDEMKKCKLNKVLLVATGALMNPTMTNQKLTIPAIAHAVSLEVIK
ncbi:MAG: stage V sporulation protein AD [Bacilli bacterium]|nr:stage V sporulation protein AD [Bacilli bacterium]